MYAAGVAVKEMENDEMEANAGAWRAEVDVGPVGTVAYVAFRVATSVTDAEMKFVSDTVFVAVVPDGGSAVVESLAVE